MSEIRIEIPDQHTLDKLDVFSWPVWEKEISTFDWHYDRQETCYIVEGKVRVEPKDGTTVVDLRPGDLVTFPAGLDCVWKVTEPIKKHFTFD